MNTDAARGIIPRGRDRRDEQGSGELLLDHRRHRGGSGGKRRLLVIAKVFPFAGPNTIEFGNAPNKPATLIAISQVPQVQNSRHKRLRLRGRQATSPLVPVGSHPVALRAKSINRLHAYGRLFRKTLVALRLLLKVCPERIQRVLASDAEWNGYTQTVTQLLQHLLQQSARTYDLIGWLGRRICIRIEPLVIRQVVAECGSIFDRPNGNSYAVTLGATRSILEVLKPDGVMGGDDDLVILELLEYELRSRLQMIAVDAA